MAAYECGSTDFPSPPYPDSILCPEDDSKGKVAITMWAIMSKVIELLRDHLITNFATFSSFIFSG